ncbi:hypothetical protein K6W38_01265 [Burkholderia contaminans]|nr:hypothetical protein [Burkholderia contaminans]
MRRGIWSIAGASPPARSVSPRATAEATGRAHLADLPSHAIEDRIRHVRRKLRRDLRGSLGDRGFRACDDGCHRGVHVVFGHADTPALRDPVARLDLVALCTPSRAQHLEAPLDAGSDGRAGLLRDAGRAAGVVKIQTKDCIRQKQAIACQA